MYSNKVILIHFNEGDRSTMDSTEVNFQRKSNLIHSTKDALILGQTAPIFWQILGWGLLEDGMGVQVREIE